MFDIIYSLIARERVCVSTFALALASPNEWMHQPPLQWIDDPMIYLRIDLIFHSIFSLIHTQANTVTL